jgi:hypothetical protein
VSEWFNVRVLKTRVRESVPWVRIPPSPPLKEDNMDYDKLAQTIIDAYGEDCLLSSELVVYRTKNDQVIRDTITIDFSDSDYQYHTSIKPIYTE